MKRVLNITALMLLSSSYAFSLCTYDPPQIIGGNGCPGSSYTLKLTIDDNGFGTAFVWKKSVDGGLTWETISGQQESIMSTGPLSVSTRFWARTTEFSCGEIEEYFEADIATPPNPPVANSTSLCLQGGAQVSVNYVSNHMYDWYQGDVLLNPSSGTPPIALAHDQTFGIGQDGNSVLNVEHTNETLTFSVKARDLGNSCGQQSLETIVTITVHPLPSINIGSNEAVCVNASNMNLSATPANGTWSSASPGLDVNVFKPAIASFGVHTVRYDFTNTTTGCSNFATKTITVNPNILPVDHAVCVSNPVAELTASPGGGTWTGPHVTSDGFFDAHSAGVGSHTVSYTVTSGGCTGSRAGTITVSNGTPPPFPYNIPVKASCGGASVKLEVSVGELDTDISHFLWLNASNVVQRKANGVVAKDAFFDTPHLSSQTTYKVLAIAPNGCAFEKSATATVIDITPPSVINGNNCANGSGTVAVNPIVPNVTYHWRIGTTPIEEDATIEGVTYDLPDSPYSSLGITGVSGAQDHTVYVSFESNALPGCKSDETPATLLYRTLPTVTFDGSIPTTFCHSTPLYNLSGASPLGGSWDLGGTPISSSFVASNHQVGNTVIGYTYTNQYNCTKRELISISIIDPAQPESRSFFGEYEEPLDIQLINSAGLNMNYRWYDGESSQNVVTTGDGYQITSLTSPRNYYLTRYRTDLPNCEGTTRSTISVVHLPPNNFNYVKEEVMQVEGVTVASDFDNLAVTEKLMSTTYVDGLGRTSQAVQWRASPGENDVVAVQEYDLAGRDAKKYLPYTSQQNGWFKKKALKDESYVDSEQYLFYQNSMNGKIAADEHPYAVTIFEESPLNRVLVQGAPGAEWQPSTSHTIKKEYALNSSDDPIYRFIYSPATGQITATPGSLYYLPNTLYRNTTIDEHGNDVLEFVDQEGRTVCKKVFAEPGTPSKYACTYYIYDDLGNLVVVIPPEGLQRIIDTN